MMNRIDMLKRAQQNLDAAEKALVRVGSDPAEAYTKIAQVWINLAKELGTGRISE